MKRRFFLFPLLAAVLLGQTTASEVEITAEPSHNIAIENEHVRVFKVEVAPNAATLLHRHRHDYLFVTLGDSHVENAVEGKAPIELKLSDGETRFTFGDFAHVARNLSNQPFRNVTIELIEDAKMRTAPSPWPMEGGDREFPGGKIKVLYVRDGARVSMNELQPGATIPSHHHDGPHLLVAVSDLDVRSDVDGQGPMPGKFKSGDVKWLPGGYTHTLTNSGPAVARFVTVEFAGANAQLPAQVQPRTVDVRANISERGEVLEASIVGGQDEALDQRVLNEVKTWRFNPAMKDGRPVQVMAIVKVSIAADGTILKPAGVSTSPPR